MMRPPRHFFMLLLLNLLFCRIGHASFEHLETSARAGGMGGAFTGLPASSFAIFYNPAGQALLSSREASFFYTQHFGFDELSQFSASYTDPVLLPNGAGTIGIGIKQYGFELYRETTLALSYANSLHKKFFFAVTVTYNQLTIRSYGNDAAVGIDAGILALITPDLSIGFSALNLNRPTLSESREPLAQSYTLGLCYHLSKDLRVLVDAEKDPRFPLMIKSGVEFDPIPRLSLRGGFSSEPSRISAGIGIHYGMFNIDYAFATHADLGITHFGAITIRFGNNASNLHGYGGIGAVIDKAFSSEEKVNLNSAGASELLELPGINRQTARRILMYREEYGGFKNTSELLRIRGISEELFETIQDKVVVGETPDKK